MFTGIVEEMGKVGLLRQEGNSAVLRIDAEKVLEDLAVGDSVAADGVCLTVTRKDNRGLVVELSPETLRRTNLGSRRPGDLVNLERAVAVGSRMGGHYVQGHVDGIGQIVARRREGDAQVVAFRAPEALMPYIVDRGFIAVDGISLTVVRRTTDTFTATLVRHTQEMVTLSRKPVGSTVNLEVDVMAKYVENLLAAQRAAS